MERIQWSDIARAARETSEALGGGDWVGASIKARVLLADLADEVERLAAERDAKMSRPGELLMDVLKSARGVDHPILDAIVAAVGADREWCTWSIERKGECLEFDEPSTPGQRFEIVVRPIDGDEDEEPTCRPPAGP
jgi:hypothetical protein